MKLLKEVKEEPKELKTQDRSKVYTVGERCLARWRDNRRFVATIDKDLGDGELKFFKLRLTTPQVKAEFLIRNITRWYEKTNMIFIQECPKSFCIEVPP